MRRTVSIQLSTTSSAKTARAWASQPQWERGISWPSGLVQVQPQTSRELPPEHEAGLPGNEAAAEVAELGQPSMGEPVAQASEGQEQADAQPDFQATMTREDSLLSTSAESTCGRQQPGNEDEGVHESAVLSRTPSSHRSNLTYFITPLEERVALATLYEAPVSDGMAKPSPSPRARRSSSGYLLERHRTRHEAQVASSVTGSACPQPAAECTNTEYQVVHEPMLEAQALEPEAGEQRPRGSRPQQRARRLVRPNGAAHEAVVAWSPLRGGSAASAKTAAEPVPQDEPLRLQPHCGNGLRNPRRRRSWVRNVLRFPVQHTLPIGVGAAWGPDDELTPWDEASEFRSTGASFCTTYSEMPATSKSESRPHSHRGQGSWSAEWASQNSTPLRYRFAVDAVAQVNAEVPAESAGRRGPATPSGAAMNAARSPSGHLPRVRRILLPEEGVLSSRRLYGD